MRADETVHQRVRKQKSGQMVERKLLLHTVGRRHVPAAYAPGVVDECVKLATGRLVEKTADFIRGA